MIRFILIYLLLGKVWCSQEPEKSTYISEIKPTTNEVVDALQSSETFEKENHTQEALDSTVIKNFLVKFPEFTTFKKDLLLFYNQRGFSCAWLHENDIAEHTFALYNKVLQLIDHGIPYNAPYLNQFKSILENKNEDVHVVNEKELLISCHYLYFINSINTSITEKDIESLAWYIRKKRIDPQKMFETLISDSSKIGTAELYPQYYKLLEGFKTYLTAEKSGQWRIIYTNKKKFNLLDTADEIKRIRKNLYLLGDLHIDSGEGIYDTAMSVGINSFQQRHGLKIQTTIEMGFIRMMNVPLQERIKQILINMERCKWLPNETSSDYIVVNIPQYSLYVYTADSLVFNCKVVVGKETNRTMIFKGDMKFVVFSPYWNVPESILKNEIIPAIQRNPNYLNDNNMEWYNGRIRQRPGETNALGRVKFLFPNVFNIYLHDTPSKSLFEFEKRTFSHGCIRISEPMKLAQFLLRKNPSWDEQRITDAMLSGVEKTVKLDKGIPVYVIYLTSFADERGTLNFREDVYGRDEALKEMLFDKKPLQLD